MAEKAATTPPFLFTALIAASFAGVLLFCTIDGRRLLPSPPPQTISNFAAKSCTNFSDSRSAAVPLILEPGNPNSAPARQQRWFSAELETNYTAVILSRSSARGGTPCEDSPTVEISIPGIDGADGVQLSTGEIHDFRFQALDDSSNPKCSGGDYFETSISGDRWRSRPFITDHGNGTYGFSLQIHHDFAGYYNLTVILLFRRFQGLKHSPARFAVNMELRFTTILFHNTGNPLLPELKTCRRSDFQRGVWTGRWTKLAGPTDCPVDSDGRFRCLPAEQPCRNPWCSGEIGQLESNGWVYSAHCSFNIFNSSSAWNCLKNKWIFFWGDSNHVDTVRNLIRFVLNLRTGPVIVGRRFDRSFTNPENPAQTLRITSIFNGHFNQTKNYLGLHSLQDDTYRRMLTSYFSGERVPDLVVANSGLHDGVYWRSIRRYAPAAEYAARFWAGVLTEGRTEFIYRTTVAAGGYARALAFNPSKMEAFNGVMVEAIRAAGVASGVIDGFDLTYAWHFDNRCNDGVHYGRPPARLRWRDGVVGHHYFVDLMMCHVILNSICGG